MSEDEANILRAMAPKSDQLNADDLVSGERIITIDRVTTRSTPDQPVSVYYVDDGGKPWKPCKTMLRVLVEAWGPNVQNWRGQRAALFNDKSVKWGGVEVGGIRIAGLTGIGRDRTFSITKTKGKREPMRVRSLGDANQSSPTSQQKQDNAAATRAAKAKQAADGLVAKMAAAKTANDLASIVEASRDTIERLRAYPEEHARIEAERNKARFGKADDPLDDSWADEPGDADPRAGETATVVVQLLRSMRTTSPRDMLADLDAAAKILGEEERLAVKGLIRAYALHKRGEPPFSNATDDERAKVQAVMTEGANAGVMWVADLLAVAGTVADIPPAVDSTPDI